MQLMYRRSLQLYSALRQLCDDIIGEEILQRPYTNRKDSLISFESLNILSFPELYLFSNKLSHSPPKYYFMFIFML